MGETYTADGQTSEYHGLHVNNDCNVVAIIEDHHDGGLSISGEYSLDMLERNLNGGNESITVNLSASQQAAHNAALGDMQNFMSNNTDISNLPSTSDHYDTGEGQSCTPLVASAKPTELTMG